MRATIALFIASLCSTSAFADPVIELEKLASSCRAAFLVHPNTSTRKLYGAEKWIKVVRGPAEVAYDAQKTNSLVTPITGFIRITYAENHSSAADDEDAAKSMQLQPNGDGGTLIYQINMAFRGDKWEITDGRISSSTISNGRRDKGIYADERREVFLKMRGKNPWKNCMPDS